MNATAPSVTAPSVTAPSAHMVIHDRAVGHVPSVTVPLVMTLPSRPMWPASSLRRLELAGLAGEGIPIAPLGVGYRLEVILAQGVVTGEHGVTEGEMRPRCRPRTCRHRRLGASPGRTADVGGDRGAGEAVEEPAGVLAGLLVGGTERRGDLADLLADLTPVRTPSRTPSRTPNAAAGLGASRVPVRSPSRTPSRWKTWLAVAVGELAGEVLGDDLDPGLRAGLRHGHGADRRARLVAGRRHVLRERAEWSPARR